MSDAQQSTVLIQRHSQPQFRRAASSSGGRKHKVVTQQEADKYPHEDHAELDGTLKAFVFGFNDGLCANTCLMLGMASASSVHPQLVVASGLVGLFAGAASMGAGEWISGTLANSAERGEVMKEWKHLSGAEPYGRRAEEDEEHHFKEEMRELGFKEATVEAMCVDMRADPSLKIKAHCKFELGLEGVEWDEQNQRPINDGAGSADTVRSMLMMVFAFSLGAAVPLLPWISAFGISPQVAVVASLVCALAASLLIGTVVAKNFTPAGDHSTIITSQVTAAAFAIAAVYAIGIGYQRMGGSISAATTAG